MYWIVGSSRPQQSCFLSCLLKLCLAVAYCLCEQCSNNSDHCWHRMSSIQINVSARCSALCEIALLVLLSRDKLPQFEEPLEPRSCKCSDCGQQRLQPAGSSVASRVSLDAYRACEKERNVCYKFMARAIIKSLARIEWSLSLPLTRSGGGLEQGEELKAS